MIVSQDCHMKLTGNTHPGSSLCVRTSAPRVKTQLIQSAVGGLAEEQQSVPRAWLGSHSLLPTC